MMLVIQHSEYTYGLTCHLICRSYLLSWGPGSAAWIFFTPTDHQNCSRILLLTESPEFLSQLGSESIFELHPNNLGQGLKNCFNPDVTILALEPIKGPYLSFRDLKLNKKSLEILSVLLSWADGGNATGPRGGTSYYLITFVGWKSKVEAPSCLPKY